MTINLNEYIGTSVAIPLAKQGEYGKEVTFDFSAWVEMFGSGSIGWSIQRPQDTAAYLLPSTEDGTVSTITLTETESQNSGYGLLEVFYVNTGETEKRISQTFSIRIDKSLQNVGEAPSPWQSYVDAVHADALAAEEAASSILDLTATATVDSSVGTPSVSVEVSTEDDHKNMAFAFSNIKGEQGEQGETGNGISSVSVAKTATVGNVDTYTMTVNYTDGDSDTATFDVTNGEVTEEEFRKAFPTDTASGSIASYPDGADMPVKDLKVAITPVQNLNGYANPWVGGGGKNKFDPNSTSHEWVNGSNQIITLGSCISNRIPVTEGTSVVLSQANAASATNVYMVAILDENDNVLSRSTFASGQTSLVKAVPANGVVAIAGFYTASEVSNPQFEVGSSATSYAPYSNICPITGWTGANVVRTGKNLLKNRGASGSSNGITWTVNNDGSITLGGTATNAVNINMNTAENLWFIGRGRMTLVCSVDANYNPQITGLNFQSDIYVDGAYVSTLQYGGAATKSYNGGVISVGLSRLRINNGTVIPNGTKFYPQIEIGSTPTAYEVYSGNTYSIPFGQTVYGGTLDVTSGVLTVDRAYDLLNNANLWETNSWGFRYNQDVSLPRKIYDNSFVGLICSVAPVNSSATWTARWNSAGGSKVGFVNASGVVTLEQVKSLATNGQISVVYELASPQSVQLTPTEVKSLLGNNNVFADCGDSEVEYLADVTLYIQKLTGSTEDDMVANQNIANNKYFMVGNRLFFSTSAIAQGASIVVGTNCTETNLADALNALNS